MLADSIPVVASNIVGIYICIYFSASEAFLYLGGGSVHNGRNGILEMTRGKKRDGLKERRSLLLAQEGQSPHCSPELRAQTVEKHKASLSPPFRPFRFTRRSNLTFPPSLRDSPSLLPYYTATYVDLGVASKAMEKQMSRCFRGTRKHDLGFPVSSFIS